MITLKNVSKIFNTKDQSIHAVNNVSLEINDGEIFGLIGFSGAGKSTLIRCLNLLEKPTSGEVIVDGVDISKLSPKDLRVMRYKIGMIFQHFNLLPSRTIYNNIAFPLKHSNLTKEEKHKKVTELLKLVELEDKAKAYPSELSGGQKQRVAIARALANNPKILLCDEATSALDPQTTSSILKLLKKVNQEFGITIVLITHEMNVIKEICDRVGIMEDGEIRELNNVVELFANPQATITKNFIQTTTNMQKVYDLIKEDSPLVALKENEKICLLTYSSTNTNEALISYISRTFKVDANIIFGNVEVLQNEPLGRLVVKFSGGSEAITLAIAYLVENKIKVEVLKEC